MKRRFCYLAVPECAVAIWRGGGSGHYVGTGLSVHTNQALRLGTSREVNHRFTRLYSAAPTKEERARHFFGSYQGDPLNATQLSNIITNLEEKGAHTNPPHPVLHASHLAYLLPLTTKLPHLQKRLTALIPLANARDYRQFFNSLAQLTPNLLESILEAWREQPPTSKTPRPHLKDFFEALRESVQALSQTHTRNSCLALLLQYHANKNDIKGILWVLEEMKASKAKVEESLRERISEVLGVSRDASMSGEPEILLDAFAKKQQQRSTPAQQDKPSVTPKHARHKKALRDSNSLRLEPSPSSSSTPTTSTEPSSSTRKTPTTTTTSTTTTPASRLPRTSKQREVSQALREEKISDALRIAEEAQRKDAFLSVLTLIALTAACLRKEHIQHFDAAMNILQKTSHPITLGGYTKLLFLAGQEGEIVRGMEIVKEMEQKGKVVNAETFFHLARGLQKSRKPSNKNTGLGTRILEEMERRNLPIEQAPKLALIIAQYLAKEGKAEEIERVLAKTDGEDTALRSNWYAHLVSAYLQQRRLSKAMDVLARMKVETPPVTLSLSGYLRLLQGVRRLGSCEPIAVVFKEMLEADVKIDPQAFNVVVECCVQGKGAVVDTLHKILTLARPHLTVTSKHVATLFHTHIERRASEEQLWARWREFQYVDLQEDALGVVLRYELNMENKKKAEEVLRVMEQKGITPSPTDLALYESLGKETQT